MATKNSPGKFDCYVNAEPDEPMFVLLGRDRHAPLLVWLWARMREFEHERDDVVEEATACANSMAEYLKVKGKEPAELVDALEVLVGEIARIHRYAKKRNEEKGR